jgi:hypothetical protein
MSETYIETAVSAPKEKALRKLEKSYKDINKLPSYKIVWFLVVRHKFGLVCFGLILELLNNMGGLLPLFDSLRGLL